MGWKKKEVNEAKTRKNMPPTRVAPRLTETRVPGYPVAGTWNHRTRNGPGSVHGYPGV